MRVFVDAQVLQILFAGAREINLIEDFVGRPPISNKRQDKVTYAQGAYESVIEREPQYRHTHACRYCRLYTRFAKSTTESAIAPHT